MPVLLDAERAKEAYLTPPQPKGLTRRQLLASGAGLAGAGIAPGMDPARGADATKVGAPPTTAVVLNVCPETARRIAEITGRNRIRAEAGLPLLSIPTELRRMKNTADAAKFEAFAEVHRKAVCDEVLAPERKKRGLPNWRPETFMEGLAYQGRVGRILRQRFVLEPHDSSERPSHVAVILRSDRDTPRAAISRSD